MQYHCDSKTCYLAYILEGQDYVLTGSTLTHDYSGGDLKAMLACYAYYTMLALRLNAMCFVCFLQQCEAHHPTTKQLSMSGEGLNTTNSHMELLTVTCQLPFAAQLLDSCATAGSCSSCNINVICRQRGIRRGGLLKKLVYCRTVTV